MALHSSRVLGKRLNQVCGLRNPLHHISIDIFSVSEHGIKFCFITFKPSFPCDRGVAIHDTIEDLPGILVRQRDQLDLDPSATPWQFNDCKINRESNYGTCSVTDCSIGSLKIESDAQSPRSSPIIYYSTQTFPISI